MCVQQPRLTSSYVESGLIKNMLVLQDSNSTDGLPGCKVKFGIKVDSFLGNVGDMCGAQVKDDIICREKSKE